MLAKGAHGGMGAFAGFLLPIIGTLLMAYAMLKGLVFRRLAALTGIVGTMFLLAYITGLTFGLAPTGVLMAIALLGGLLMIAWNVMVAKKLFALAGKARD